MRLNKGSLTILKVHRYFIAIISFLLIFMESADALSCREVTSTYDKTMSSYYSELSKYRKLQATLDSPLRKAERDKLNSANDKRLATCQKKAKSSKARSKCDSVFLSEGLRIAYSGIASTSKYEVALDTAQRIVLNNKKCFNPTLVAEIQRARGINP
jgi:Skp family chaperone for outer membrane proteins